MDKILQRFGIYKKEIIMLKTTDYFEISLDELLNTNEYGYTREELKIYDEGLKVHFCENVKEHNIEREDIIKWYKDNLSLQLTLELETINGRIAMIFN